MEFGILEALLSIGIVAVALFGIIKKKILLIIIFNLIIFLTSSLTWVGISLYKQLDFKHRLLSNLDLKNELISNLDLKHGLIFHLVVYSTIIIIFLLIWWFMWKDRSE